MRRALRNFFLRGDDGLWWYERRRYAKEFYRTVGAIPTQAEADKIRRWLESKSTDKSA